MSHRRTPLPTSGRVVGYVLVLGAGLLIWLLASAAPSHADDPTPTVGGVPIVGELVTDVTGGVVAIAADPPGTLPLIGRVVDDDQRAVGDVVDRVRATGHDVQRLPEQAVEVVEAAPTSEPVGEAVQQVPVSAPAPTSRFDSVASGTAVAEGPAAATPRQLARSATVPAAHDSPESVVLPVNARPDHSTSTADHAQADSTPPSFVLDDAGRGHAASEGASGGTGTMGQGDDCRLVLPDTLAGASATAAQHNVADRPALLPAASPG